MKKNKIPESFAIFSIENFLSNEDLNKINLILKEIKKKVKVQFGKYSVHNSDGISSKHSPFIFEPNGRYELNNIPKEITEILDIAVKSNLSSIKEIFPKAKHALPWNYVEYNSNQYCNSHVDYLFKTEKKEIVYCGIGIMLKNAEKGGEFYIETSGSSDYISNGKAKKNLNYSNDKFIKMPKTKWVVEQGLGTALLYGTQTIHGTNPVLNGKCKKIISWIAG